MGMRIKMPENRNKKHNTGMSFQEDEETSNRENTTLLREMEKCVLNEAMERKKEKNLPRPCRS